MRASSIHKALDRYLGIPLVCLLGWSTRKRKMSELSESPQIALLHTAAIGDTILLSGAVADLRKRWPKSEIIFFVGASNYEAALLIPDITVVQLPVLSIGKSLSMLRARSFDLWIDFGSWARINAVYSYFSRAKYKIGFSTPGQYRHFVYDQTAPHQSIHELENIRNLLKLLGIQEFLPPQLIPLKSVPQNQIVLHLYAGGSRAALKEWPEKYAIALIDALTARGFSVVLTGSMKDYERCNGVKGLCKQLSAIHVLAGAFSLRESAQLLMSSKAIISIDTGIMHLAAALGCLTIGLHGPTSPHRWGGIGPRVISIRSEGKIPCLHLGFENTCFNCDCMSRIQVKQVLETLEKHL